MTLWSSVKYSVPFTSVSFRGDPHPPAQKSLTSTVPASVPSLRQSSDPSHGVHLLKRSALPTLVSSEGTVAEDGKCVTFVVPASEPLLFQTLMPRPSSAKK